MNLNVLYIHGALSKFDANNERIKHIEKLVFLDGKTQVFGIDYQLSDSLESIKAKAYASLIKHDIDVVVGCSFGGFLASHIVDNISVDCVVINPVLSANTLFNRYDDINNDFIDKEINTGEVDYVFLGDEDKIINPINSYHYFKSHNVGVEIGHGDHRYIDVNINDKLKELFCNNMGNCWENAD